MPTHTLLRRAGIGVVTLSLGLVTACGASKKTESGDKKDSGPITGLTVTVPGKPASGFDTFARAWTKVLEDSNLAKTITVENTPGANGVVGLQAFNNKKGNGKALLQMGLGVLGAASTASINKSGVKLSDATPIAKMMEESEAIAVPANSPYKTLADLITAWKANPGKVTVGGGSGKGGPDFLAPMLFAKAAGITPKDVNYTSYDGGEELMVALLGSKISFGVTGVGEVTEQAKAGKVKVLAVTSAAKVEGLDAPTLKDSGIDLVFANWRGIVAAPGISADDKAALVAAITKLHDTQAWKDTLAKKQWTDAFVVGEEYATFLTNETSRVTGVLGDLGLAS